MDSLKINPRDAATIADACKRPGLEAMLLDERLSYFAIHEAEKTLSYDEQYTYGSALASIVRKPELEAAKRDGQDEDDQFPLNGLGHFHLAHLTAAQRLEALLKVKGLRKE